MAPPPRARAPRLRPLRELSPPQAWQRLQRVRSLLRQRGGGSALDVLLADALAHLATLLATQAWVRHDPDCDHRRPSGAGPTRCTCGLSATRRAHFSDEAGLPGPTRRAAPSPESGADCGAEPAAERPYSSTSGAP